MKILLNDNWKIINAGKYLNASVPGDITIDMFNAGLISNPYIAENYKDAEWVGRKDYDYINNFEITKEMLSFSSIKIVFKGIDVFSEIYVNGHLLGKTKNAFLKYIFEIRDYLKEGQNELKVHMISTLNEMDKIDTTGYFAIFNLPRMFVRKAQCHFGWDWAPKICAYGIIDDVYLECKNKYQIEETQIVTDDRGNLRFQVKLNYDNKNFIGPDDIILKQGEPMDDDKLVFYVSKTPFGDDYDKYEIPMMGVKNYLAIKVKDAQLWWPTGYGEQPLYNYRIELLRGNKVQDAVSGRFAYRKIELIEDAKPNNQIGMDFYINGKKIFLKGSNWVPPECFTGVMEDDKYRKLIKLAKNMNANILRVWGGGAYEKDIFFDICDEEGILTWQDFCLACADIPDDKPEFLDNFLDEVRYQIIRLRNHPSLIYWCGGNEKTGCYGNCITHGDFLVNDTLYGIVMDMDGTRPYRRQSPHAYSDIGNNPNSGDSHHNNFEKCFLGSMEDYRYRIANELVPFVSECAVMGPSSEETLRKIFPEDKLWPMNEMWNDRFMENPYSGVPNSEFPKREYVYATKLFDQVYGLTDFIQKAMIAQAESLKAESDFQRAHCDVTGAFLNWMFDDIWPSGTWATVDYYLEPKQAYYALKKSFAPLLVSFYEDNKGLTHFFVNNQTINSFSDSIEVSVKNYDGKVFYNKVINVNLDSLETYDEITSSNDINGGTYVVAKYKYDGEIKNSIYSKTFFAHLKFNNDFTYEVNKVNDNKVEIKITANAFVKSLFIYFKDNYKYIFSDNYIDLEKGDEATIIITSIDKIDLSTLKIEPFLG